MSPFFLKVHISETLKYEFSTVKAIHRILFSVLLQLSYSSSILEAPGHLSLFLCVYLTHSVPAYDMFCDIVDEIQILLESTQAVNIPFTLVLP